jgi:hypothetical protein
MEKNLVCDSVVPTTTLVGMEGYVVDFAGVKVHNGLTTQAMGVVKTGFAANKASEIAIAGRIPAYVDGASANVAQYDPLVAAGMHSGTSIVASVDGVFYKATVGTHQVRAVALEAATTLKQIDVYLIGH